MAAPDAPTPSPAETLAWEAANRPRAALAAWLAGILTFGGAVITSIAFGGIPKYNDRVVTVIDGLGDTVAGKPIPPGRAVAQLQYIGDHPLPFIAGPLITALAAVLLYFALAYLFKATRARTAQVTQVVLIALAAGAVAYAVGTAVVGVFRVIEATNLAADATNRDALESIQSGPLVVGTVVQLAGAFALGFALVMLSINAMRVGLLTRFVGIIGAIAGVTFVLPLDQQGIIRAFWLGALGFLIAGRWPSPVPAWETGKAEPWPSAQEARRQRAGEPAPAPPTPEPAPPPDGLTQGQRRKKRKKG